MDDVQYQIQGNGKVSIKDDGTTEFLEIEGKIIALNVAGPHSNMHNAYFIKGDFSSTFVNDTINKINFAPDPQVNFFVTYDSDIEALLANFEPGTFTIEKPLTNTPVSLDSDFELIVEWDSDPLRCTRISKHLKRETIEYHKQTIQDGFYPLVLAYRKDYPAGEESCTYIIDGHHKLAAYAALGYEPNIWTIVNASSERYDLTDQRIRDYLNHEAIKDTLKYFYHIEENESGKLTRLVLK